MANNRRRSNNNNGYREGEMSFREWLPTYEREQEHHSNQIAGLISSQSQLSADVATLSANVQTLLKTQNSIYDRMNRPWQWGVVVAAFAAILSSAGIFGTILTLSLSPVKDRLDDYIRHTLENEKTIESRINILEEAVNKSQESQRWLEIITLELEKELETTQKDMGNHGEAIEWLKSLEDRVNRRMHGAIER